MAMKGKNSGLLIIILLIFILSACSGCLRTILNKDLKQLYDANYRGWMISGYLFLPAYVILADMAYMPRRKMPVSMLSLFCFFLGHLAFISIPLGWIYISVVRWGLGNSYVMLSCILDVAIILLLVGNFALNR